MLEDLLERRRNAEPLTQRRAPAGLASLYTAVSCFTLEVELLLLSTWAATVWAPVACEDLALPPSALVIPVLFVQA